MIATNTMGKRGQGSIYRLKGRKIWWLKYYRNGHAFRETTETDNREEALRKLRECMYELDRGSVPSAHRIRFAELAEDMVADYQVNRKKTLKDLESRLKRHINPVFGKMRVTQITAADINHFIAYRHRKGAGNAEINRELTVIRRAFSLGISGGKIFRKPQITLLRENNVRTGFFEPGEFGSLCKHLPEAVREVVIFAYITGWRIQSEVLPLRWSQVDFAGKEIRLEPGTTKNTEGRVFPLTDALDGLLRLQLHRTEALQGVKGILIPNVFHRQGRPIHYFYRSWKSACQKAGLAGRIPHDLRRTAVRNLVRAGITERVAMRMTGHKTRSVFERYNIVSDTDLREAGARLDQNTGTITGIIDNNPSKKESAND